MNTASNINYYLQMTYFFFFIPFYNKYINTFINTNTRTYRLYNNK